MPGIAGVISSKLAPHECDRLVKDMLGSMEHKSSYVSGVYSAPELGVFAGWVAHAGSFADCQPILSADGSIVVLFSGECFADLSTLTQLGGTVNGFTPLNAAWLARLYEHRGDRFFSDLNGIFSGLVIDRRQHRAFLFNDRYGMRRVYYHEGKDGFFFASEAKALLRILPELREFDETGLAEYLRYGFTLDSHSLFRGISLLPGASMWSFDGERCKKDTYFNIDDWESQPQLSPDSFQAQLDETFKKILPPYFESNGDIGISLTGGLDTRMIMACRPETRHRLVAYTFAGPEGDMLDVRVAARVAAACDVPHHVLRIGSDFFSDFSTLADTTVYVTDGTFGITGAHEIYLNSLARQLATVRLTGNFGSEVLRGVTTFKPLGLSPDLLNSDANLRVSAHTPASITAPMHPASFAAFKEVPWHLGGVVSAAESQVTTRTPYLDNTLVALAYQTPPQLRRSPQTALSLIRGSDAVLARIATDSGLIPASPVMSRVLSPWYRVAFKLDYLSGDGMPHWFSGLDEHLRRLDPGHRVVGAHKFLHYRRWFRGRLSEYVRERLTDPSIMRHPLWNDGFLDQLTNDLQGGRKNYVSEINAVLTLDAIERLLLKQEPACRPS